MKKLLLFFFIISFSLIAKCQTITKWDSLGGVRAITVDKNDNVWVLWWQYNILSKYDGNKWINYKKINNDSLANISAIETDRDGNVWILTNHFGELNHCHTDLIKYDGVNWTTYNVKGDFIGNCISIDYSGNIWLGGMGGGIQVFDGVNWNKYKIELAFYSIAFDNNNESWLGSAYEFNMFDRTIITHYYYNGATDKWVKNGKPYGGAGVASIVIDKHNTKYLASRGLIKVDDSIGDIIYPDSIYYSTFNKLVIDSNNTVWCVGFVNDSSLKSLFYKFENNVLKEVDLNNILNKNLSTIAIDHKGNKWIGSEFSGLIRYSDGGAGPLVRKTIRGTVFLDDNNNGIFDNGEQGIGNQIISIDNRFSTSDGNGKWACMPINGIAHISYLPKTNWVATTPAISPIDISKITSDTIVNIGIRPVNNINDLSVQLEGSCTRANFNSYYWLNYTNLGTNTQKGLVSFQYDTRATFVSSNPTADSVQGNQLFWKYDTLASFEQRQINIQLQMPDVAHLGDTINSYARISGNYSDINLANNIDTLRQRITGSYDPNEKLVSPMGKTDEHLTPFDTELTYTIHFQNTGTDTAFNVAVRDTISTNMNMSTFELLGSSHPVQLDIKGGNIVTFHFDNINLPDSAHNQLGSNGFVKYRIKPKSGLTEGTLINNRAYIFFDMNPPILTNVAFNKYSNGLTFPSGVKDYVSIISVPSPMLDQANLVFKNPNNSTYTLRISNLQGMKVMEVSGITGSQYTLKRGSLKQGIYMMQLIPSSGDMLVGKLVVE